VIGGHVYHGTKAPELAGLYVSGQFISGRMWTLTQSGTTFTRASLLNVAALDVLSIGQDQLGELYVGRYSTGAVSCVGSSRSIAVRELAKSRQIGAFLNFSSAHTRSYAIARGGNHDL